MSKALRLESSRYSLATRLRARELYLYGRTYDEICDEIYQEQLASEAAKKKGKKTAVAAVARIDKSVIKYWANRGGWSAQRQYAERFAEREQLRQVRRALATEMKTNLTSLNFLQGFAQQYFMREAKDKSGNTIYLPDGRPKMIPRGPEDWSMESPDKAISAMMAIIRGKTEYVKLVTDLLGDALPKIDPAAFVPSTPSGSGGST